MNLCCILPLLFGSLGTVLFPIRLLAQTGLTPVVVQGVNPDDTTIPGHKLMPSALGLDLRVQDIPRSVTVLSDMQLNDADIRESEDLVRLIPDAYTYHVNGSPGTPLIRGQYADVLVNGFRLGLTSNGVGTPIDFNAAESVDVFRGPEPAIYGASIYNGGYINLVTKQPFFDGYHGGISSTFGMYEQRRWTAEVGGPLIKDKLAFRVFYTGEESGSFYRNDHLQNQAVYSIFSYKPSDTYRVDLLNDFYATDYEFNNGINRPTQQLIDSGLYITGTQQYVNPTGSPVTAQTYPTALVPSHTPSFNGVVVPTGLVRIDRSRNLINPGDGSYAKTDLTQLIQTLQLSPDFQVLNTSSFYYLVRRQFAALRYSAVVKPTYAAEDRLEFKLDFDQPLFGGGASTNLVRDKDGNSPHGAVGTSGFTLQHQLNVGFDYRYQNVYAATDFNHETSNLYDLTENPNRIVYPLSQVTSNAPGSNRSYLVPGTRFYASTGGTYNNVQANTGNGETNNSDSSDYVVYLQDRITLFKPVSVFFGVRGDLLDLNYVDVVHPAGFKPVSYSTVLGMYNLNTSITCQPVPAVTFYFTYDRTQTTNSAQAGGVRLEPDNRIVAADYHNENTLYEGGAKTTLLGETLFLGVAVFSQTRTVPQQGAAAVKADILGAELDANYQPNKNFYVSIGYSYLDSNYHNQSLFQETVPVEATFTPPVGNGVGSPNGQPLPVRNYRQPDVPRHILSARTTYQSACGLGISFGALLTSPQNLTFDGSVKIPLQYTLDASLFFRQKNYELRLDLYNLTDQKNWLPISDFDGGDSVYAQEPFRVQGSVRMTF
ncbi:MAG TPA: TonB-dependent receptor plug domain-containing protein [Chthoniobacterales bacterium]